MTYRVGICATSEVVISGIKSSVENFFENVDDKVEFRIWSKEAVGRFDEWYAGNLNLIFFDLDENEIGTMLCGRLLREELEDHKTHFVVLSANLHVKTELFRIHPYDCLIKPIQESEMHQMLNSLYLKDAMDLRMFWYKKKQNICAVPFSCIQFWESKQHCLKMQTTLEDTIEFSGKLSDITERLPGNFVRLSQSYIVNIDYIHEYGKRKVIMKDGTEISVTKPYRTAYNILYDDVKQKVGKCR
ncbi:LytR/AlgR family response regulator transcription factor [Eubacterium oxidoreducens]|uniref:Two component transcriptional regulator, LytTR family n=1 Tax=Eubacterium oxidoreducens TaxID=1732 RepID=A0A1G6ABE5_EUBOX|nr:LytTR family transcriptional regulator DNA-binding domain-containing protein [Eubacterium oxidoreducens]SDB05732.1 two component transcriptional regulator, LytTR family [Eubacterium oxidoreducens]